MDGPPSSVLELSSRTFFLVEFPAYLSESPGPVFRHKRSYWQLADFVRSERCGRTLDRDFDSDKNVRLQALVKVDRLSVCTSGYLRLRWDHETFVWRQPCTLGWSPSSGVIAGEYTEHPSRATHHGRRVTIRP